MPELPEVETVVRALRPALTGRIVERLELLHVRTSRHSSPERLKGAVERARITGLRRRGKFILIDLDANRPTLAVHLRMSGQLLLSEQPVASPHLRAVLYFTDGGCLNFVDIRTFGTLFLLDGSEPDGFRSLGAEPLSSSFTAERFGALLAGRTTPIKALLLRQDLIAGIGNIYASEACWRARIHPARSAGSLDEGEVRRLHRAIRGVLRDAVAEMGTTLSDFRRPDGEAGRYGNQLDVYGRAGEPCHRCGTTLERLVQHGRSTFFCPRCQHSPGLD